MSSALSSVRMSTLIVACSLSLSNINVTGITVKCCNTFTEPKLHTAGAGSVGLSGLYVHDLELCTTPTCCCGERILHGSLNIIQGWPVSNNIEIILRHICKAGTRLNNLISPLSARRSYST